jgi:hypothetical protein
MQNPVSTAREPVWTATMKKKRLELRLALFSACQTSIKSVDFLPDIVSGEFGTDAIQLKRTKATALIKNVLSPHFKKKLYDDLRNVPYSIMVDETTDISVTKLLGIAIKYFSASKNDIVSTFLQVVKYFMTQQNTVYQIF